MTNLQHKNAHSQEEVATLYTRPLLDLVFEAAQVHRANHAASEVQLCTLLSIKTGNCPEDCKYCSQSNFNKTKLERENLMRVDEVMVAARKAKESGSTRFCMGAAWREVPGGRGFDRVLEMVKGVKALGMEACCTLGMLTEDQARKLKDAGLTAYNHNLDTSAEHYANVITTRTYQDRLDTIANVAKAGVSLCCGGILGMGETQADRISLLHTLCTLDPQPESVPINALVPVEGTPLQDAPPLDTFEWIRTIAVARILMPKAMVRLSAGRLSLSKEAQALAFLAGANSIFTGEKLLTTPNPEWDADGALMQTLGLTPALPGRMTVMTRFASTLRRLEAEGRNRSLRQAAGIDLSSNDYLCFSTHPALRQVALEWLEQGGAIGSGGSRLLRGNHPAHEKLEHFAAGFFNAEKALYFTNGFQANHAIFSTLPERHDVVVYDSLIHASVRAGIQGGAAPAFKFRHNDLNDCEDVLRRAREKAEYLWLAVESVYSMNGDIALLAEFYDLCVRYDAYLIADEAHATGIFGSNGRGLTEGLPQERLITLHTGGKALGVAGGLVCGSTEIIDYLVNKAPPFIYSTAPLPLQAALLHRALQLADEEPQHRERLLALCGYASKVLPVVSSPTQIIPVIMGTDHAALQAASALQEAGFDIRAVRPPTVPEGTARLRLSLNAGLNEKTLDALADCLQPLVQKQAA